MPPKCMTKLFLFSIYRIYHMMMSSFDMYIPTAFFNDEPIWSNGRHPMLFFSDGIRRFLRLYPIFVDFYRLVTCKETTPPEQRPSIRVAFLHVTFGGSGGIMTTARPELPYPWISQAKFRDETPRRGE